MSIIAKGFLTLASLGLASEYIEHRMIHTDDTLQEPVDTISIIMPSLNEEKHIKTAAQSIRSQKIIQEYPEYFEFILADSSSTDSTVSIAEPYVDRIITVPRGKLTARNIATDQSNHNIIVSVDADAYYPPNWLNTLLKPFNNPEVIAVHGSNIDHDAPFIGRLFTLIHPLYIKALSPYEMNGGNAAYYKHAFYLTGRFNEFINQLNSSEMSKEEEHNFGKRLSRLGKVIYKLNAPKVHLGGERVLCRFGLVNKDTCSSYQIGIQRFG